MNTSKFASGDPLTVEPICLEDVQNNSQEMHLLEMNKDQDPEAGVAKDSEITPENIETIEQNLKCRIAQCKSVIESLKCELSEEKERLENEVKMKDPKSKTFSYDSIRHVDYGHVSSTNVQFEDFPYISYMCGTNFDNKLNCDENLMEYEKQLQKYQNTLNLAQNEKKNAIRRQMLAKAYKLKLLEVENQCNIELLRVKQSLQCLEPLKMIASKWKTNTADTYDINNFEFIPRYPELGANSGSDINSELNNKTSKNCDTGNNEIESFD